MLTQIYNGKVLVPGGRWVNGGSVLIEDTQIKEVYSHSRLVEGVTHSINAGGGYILPGGIDIHVHGGGGRDFMEGTEEAFLTAVETHRRHGTTSIFPTLSSSSEQMIRDAAETCTKLMEDPMNGILGLHLEGPYLAPAMCGGQLPEQIRIPNPMEYMNLIEEYPCIRRWDAAPELPGGDDFGKYVASKGLVCAMAHTEACYREVQKAWESGYTLATHFYNAMKTAHKIGVYKKEGTIESVYLMDGMNIEVIADGVHVPPVILKLAYKFKGIDRMCLITDSLSVVDSDNLDKCNPPVVIENGVCKLKNGSAIAGSCATMDRLIRTAVTQAEIPLADASRMVSETPAKIMGVYDRKGSIDRHKDADIIVMNKELRLTNVIQMGREIKI